MVLPQLTQAEDSQNWNYLTILDQLTRVYDNPNKVQEAEDKLLAIRQGSDPIPIYIAKYERVLYEARGQNWPDVNKISTFRNGLNPTIRGRLSQQLNLPRTYPDFIRVVQQLAGRSTSSSTPHATPGGQDSMELGAINAISTTIQSTNGKQYTIEKLYCARCRSYGHEIEDCVPTLYNPDTQQLAIPVGRDDNSDISESFEKDMERLDGWQKF